ncbi:MAG: hypothetical protein ACLPID_00755 [Beijerinckiaceae bacterium]
MTSTDFAVYVSAVTGVVGVAYAALTYHRPKAPPVSSVRKAVKGTTASAAKTTTVHWKPFWPITLAVIAWSAAAFDYVDRHWFSTSSASEISLGPDNADLGVRLWEKGILNENNHNYFANVHLTNRGKSPATSMNHVGFGAVGPSVENSLLDSFFITLRNQVKLLPIPAASNEIHPSADDTWFSVLGPPISDDLSKGLDNGTNNLFVFNIIKYRDKTLDNGKSIYTESCVYFNKQTVHLCEGGHNRSYISD